MLAESIVKMYACKVSKHDLQRRFGYLTYNTNASSMIYHT